MRLEDANKLRMVEELQTREEIRVAHQDLLSQSPEYRGRY